MTDPIKTETEQTLADIKAKMASIEGDVHTDFSVATTWVKLHIVIIIGLAAAVVGFALGHWVF